LVIVAACVLRILVVWCAIHNGLAHLIAFDDYMGIAKEWAFTGHFPAHALCFPPVYPLLCRGAIFIFKGFAIEAILIIQVVIGTLSVYLVYLIASRLTNSERIAVLAGCLSAFDPLLLGYTSVILTETLYQIMLLAVIFMLMRIEPSKSWHFFI